MKVCQICKSPLKTGNLNNKYGTEDGIKHLSRHHLFPKRFGKYFTNAEIKRFFGINKTSEVAELDYECHEEVLHNLILNKDIIQGLSKVMEGKSKKEKIKIFHEIFKKGIIIYLQKVKQYSKI